MNKRTAALILIEDLIVLNCTYQQKPAQTYIFVSRSQWLDPAMKPGTYLLAQSRSLETFAVVQFQKLGDITDLDFDDEKIVYKFVLGEVTADQIARLAVAEQSVLDTLKAVKQQQIEALRNSAATFLKEPVTKLINRPLFGMD